MTDIQVYIYIYSVIEDLKRYVANTTFTKNSEVIFSEKNILYTSSEQWVMARYNLDVVIAIICIQRVVQILLQKEKTHSFTYY